MNTVLIHKVSGEGFGSFASKFSFNLDRPGVNLIKGKNGNGKTTLFSAFCWALFGETLKEVVNNQIATWEKSRPSTFRGTKVLLELSVNGVQYVVARHLNFSGTTAGIKGESRLLIFKVEADELKELDAHHKQDQQLFIEQLLGFNKKTFFNAILFGQGMTRLIRAKDAEKRDLFEQLFEVDFVHSALENAKVRREELLKEELTLENVINSKKLLIQHKQEVVEQKKITLEQFEQTKYTNIERAENTLKECVEQLQHYEKDYFDASQQAALYNEKDGVYYDNLIDTELKKFNSIEALCAQQKNIVTNYSSNQHSVQNNIKKLEQDLSGLDKICPTCGQDLPKNRVEAVAEQLKKAIDNEKKILKNLVKSLKEQTKQLEELEKNKHLGLEQVDKARQSKKEWETTIILYRKAYEQLPLLKEKVEAAQKRVAKAKVDLIYAKDQQQPELFIEKDLEQITQAEKDIVQVGLDLKKTQRLLEMATFWAVTGFSSKGVKSYVFNAMLTRLNQSIQQYASRLGIQVHFSVDMAKKSKPFTTTLYMDGHLVEYEQLSGGEAQRVNACLAFAMFDVLSLKININLMILDEVFEGLDEQGVDAVFDFIRLKAETGKSLYVITHMGMLDGLLCKTIMIEKDENGNSLVA